VDRLRAFSDYVRRDILEDGRVVPMTKLPIKTKKLEDALFPCTMTMKEKKKHKERMDQGMAKLGLFIIASHLQRFVENRSLQAVLKENDLVVSWDDEKKKVAVVSKPKARKRSRA
jgi:hypothetical protein